MKKDMDMKELNRRIKLGVRYIKVSPLLVAGKIYNIETYKEDLHGTLAPERTHCWLTWESRWKDEEDVIHWSKEAYDLKTQEEAEKAKLYLEKFLWMPFIPIS